ncbi:cytochrome P450 3A29-like [Oppia nitens]|uniref:cytochrome P450 3A29-like n=1 Tax=Oppia nitens TaxID=1686743 RepID=UPI0023DC4212|nr:cytochrome P450 3A29-like [Oppia nitens]
MLGPHHDYTLYAYKKYGRVYGSYDLFRKLLVINEPDLLRDIMVKDFNVFPDHKHMNLGSSTVNISLFFLPGNDQWKRVRSILSPAFTSGKLKAMMSHISDISDKFVQSLNSHTKTGAAFNIRELIGAFAMDVICGCAYGINLDSIKNPEHPVVVNAKKVLNTDVNLRQVIGLLMTPLAKLLKLEFFDLNATNFFEELTNKILQERQHKNNYTDKRRTDFIQLMIDSEKTGSDIGYDSGDDLETNKSVNEDNSRITTKGSLTPDEITGQGLLFFIAGYDTTSASITNAIYYLSKNKDCQQKLYEEIKTVDEFTYDKLNHLKYLNAVLNETLRLAPSLVRINRECVQDYQLGNTGITVPAGTSIEIYPYALHRDPEFWPEPEQFKPERFLEPTHHPFAYIPFGAGPRVCIGQRFAMNEMRMCLAKLIHSYDFSLASGAKREFFKGVPLMSPKELEVTIKAR